MRCHFFTTFFYKKLTGERGGYNYQNVRRWTKDLDVTLPDYDLGFVPIHVGSAHWCLASMDFKAKRILYYDSLGGSDNDALQHLLQYVCDETHDKRGLTVDKKQWQLHVVKKVPSQGNIVDCGVFTCKFADYLGEGQPLDFTQADMPYFRRRMLLEIRLQTLDL